MLRERQDNLRGKLRRYRILDTAPEPEYDTVATLAAHLCNVPNAAVRFVDSDRHWLHTPSCTTIFFVMADATADARFAANPLVTCAEGFRFYAGARLIAPDGYALGTLCVLGHASGELSASQADAL